MNRIIDLGKLRFHFRGDWDQNTAYELNDMVAHGACLYLYTFAVKEAGTAPTEATHWQLIVKGMRHRGVLTAGTEYLLGDVVADGASSRVALSNFTSSGSFATDTAVKWGLVALGQASVPDPVGAPDNRVVITKNGAYGLRAPRDLVRFLNHLTEPADLVARDGDDLNTDTSVASFAVPLPANPLGGEKVVLRDVTGTWGAHPLVLKGNGKKVDGFDEVRLDTPGEEITAVYVNHDLQWKLN